MTEANGLLLIACVGWGLVGFLFSRLRREQQKNQSLSNTNLELHDVILAQGVEIQRERERPVITNASGKTQMASVIMPKIEVGSEVKLPKQIGDCL